MVNKELVTRSISGIVIAIVIVLAVTITPLTLVLLCGFITVVGMMEFYKLSKYSENIAISNSISIGLIMVVLSFLTASRVISYEWMLSIIPLIFLIFIREMYQKTETPLENIAVSIGGIVYIALPMSLLVCMGFYFNGFMVVYKPVYLLGYIILIWTNDVGAYFVGRAIGKHRLFERLSPKKSWEGFVGGVFFTLLVSLAIAYLSGGNYLLWLVVAPVLAVTAVAGDLVESMFKRAAGVKDSGNLIPGHGGILDRFDAMFISIPFVYLIFRLLG